jgi:hypothetical protein
MRQVLPLLVLCAAPLAAQDGAAPTVPATWKVRADRGTPILLAGGSAPAGLSDTLRLTTMPPGWHITTGPTMIAYDPAWQASGNYRVEAEIFLFPGERREGFGLFVGGRDLEGPGQTYLYALLRKDGAVLVKRREGGATETLVQWKGHPAIVQHTGQEGTARNVLALDVAADSVRVIVNDQPVAAVARAMLPTDGQVGLRVAHALNLHVTRVDVIAK